MSDLFWNRPFSVGEHEFKNRIMYPPLSGNCANTDGSASEDILELYTRLAEGGVGSIVVSGSAISAAGKGSDKTLCIYNDAHAESLQPISDVFKQNGVFPIIQLMHVGGQGNPAFTGLETVSPSGVPCKSIGVTSRAMTTLEVEVIRNQFIQGAKLARHAGFQGVELHLAHGYLLHEFLSPRTNLRKDSYGGSAPNRLRLVSEIIEGIRRDEPNLLIGVRLSGDDFIEGGISFSMNREIVPVLEQLGVAYFSVTAGVYDSSNQKHELMKQGHFFTLARGIKSLTAKPVVGVGKILDLESAERHLACGDVDLVAMGRALLADPAMIFKVNQGRPFNRCIECHRCMYLRLGRKDLYCPVYDGVHVRSVK